MGRGEGKKFLPPLLFTLWCRRRWRRRRRRWWCTIIKNLNIYKGEVEGWSCNAAHFLSLPLKSKGEDDLILAEFRPDVHLGQDPLDTIRQKWTQWGHNSMQLLSPTPPDVLVEICTRSFLTAWKSNVEKSSTKSGEKRFKEREVWTPQDRGFPHTCR